MITTISRQRGAGIDQHRTPTLSGWASAVVTFLAACEPNSALRYGAPIALVIFLISNPLRLRIGATELLLGAFLIWCTISQLWTTVPEIYGQRFIQVLSLAAIFIGLHTATRWNKNATIATVGYILGCAYGLAQTSLQLIIGTGTVYRDSFGRITQVGDLNVNYVAYSTVTGILLILFALQKRVVRNRRLRLILVSFLLLLVFGAFSTQTRGVQISLALILLWLIISKIGRPLKTLVFVALGAIVAVTSGWIDTTLDALSFGDRSASGLSGRLPLWAAARATWEGAFFQGIGLGGDRAHNVENLATHNTILGLGMTVGAVGLGLFLAFVVAALLSRTVKLEARDVRLRLGLVVVAFVPILLTSSWEMSASGWAGLALLSNTFHVRTDERCADRTARQ